MAYEGDGFPTTQITCEFIDNDSFNSPEGYKTLKIMYAFRRTEGPGMVEYKFSIPGIRNPIKTIPTQTFKFATFSRLGELIDLLTEGVTIQMIEAAELDSVQVSLASYENARLTAYTMTLVPSVPIKETNLIMISFPEQIGLPEDPAALSCASSFTNLIESLDCTYDSSFGIPNTVRVALTLVDGVG